MEGKTPSRTMSTTPEGPVLDLETAQQSPPDGGVSTGVEDSQMQVEHTQQDAYASSYNTQRDEYVLGLVAEKAASQANVDLMRRIHKNSVAQGDVQAQASAGAAGGNPAGTHVPIPPQTGGNNLGVTQGETNEEKLKAMMRVLMETPSNERCDTSNDAAFRGISMLLAEAIGSLGNLDKGDPRRITDRTSPRGAIDFGGDGKYANDDAWNHRMSDIQAVLTEEHGRVSTEGNHTPLDATAIQIAQRAHLNSELKVLNEEVAAQRYSQRGRESRLDHAESFVMSLSIDGKSVKSGYQKVPLDGLSKPGVR